jgi:hypothetical protein
LQCLLPVFTQPSFQTHIEVLLGWVMCLSKRTEYGVFQTIQADTPVSRKERRPFDRFYNFFSRSAWTIHDLAHQVCVAVVVRLNPRGLLYFVVDDTLLHKQGKHVYGLGWFRDAVASTAKRVATASGNHWVVMGLAICIPGATKIYCLPIHAKLHLPGKGRPSEATLAKQMLDDVLALVPRPKAGFSRGWGLFGEKSARRFGRSGDARRRNACRCGDLRSTAAEAAQEQTWDQTAQGATASLSPRRHQESGPPSRWALGLANDQGQSLV